MKVYLSLFAIVGLTHIEEEQWTDQLTVLGFRNLAFGSWKKYIFDIGYYE